jgi:hypothetical protein
MMLKHVMGAVLVGALAACTQMTKQEAAALDAYHRHNGPTGTSMSMQNMIDMGYVRVVKLSDCVVNCDGTLMSAQK